MSSVNKHDVSAKAPGMLGQRDSERACAHDAKLGSSNLSHVRHRPEPLPLLCGGKRGLTTGPLWLFRVPMRVDLGMSFPYRPHQREGGAHARLRDYSAFKQHQRRGTVRQRGLML